MKTLSPELLTPCEQQILDRLNAHDVKFDKIITLLDSKVDQLIEVLSNKNMIPVQTFGWLVLFMIGFTLIMAVGVEGASALLGQIRGVK